MKDFLITFHFTTICTNEEHYNYGMEAKCECQTLRKAESVDEALAQVPFGDLVDECERLIGPVCIEVQDL